MRLSWLRLFFPICVWLAIAWIWSGTLQRDIVAPDDGWYLGDSANFVVAWHVFGVSHPPGYPLLNLLANGLVRLFSLFGTAPVLSASLVSYFTSLVALLIFAALLLNAPLAKHRAIGQGWVAGLCLLMLAFMHMTWLFASAAEAYGFGLCLAWWVWWLAVRVRQMPSARRVWLLAFGFGLAFGHHRTLALLLPALLYLIRPAYRQLRWQVWPLAMLFMALSGVVYLYVPLAVALNSPFTYGALPLNTRDGFLNLLLTYERLNELPSEAFTALRFVPDLLGDRVLGLALELTWPGLALSAFALGLSCFAKLPRIRAQGRALAVLLLCYMFAPISAMLLFSTHLPVMLVAWGMVYAIGLVLLDVVSARFASDEDERLHPFAALSLGNFDAVLANWGVFKANAILIGLSVLMAGVALVNYQQNEYAVPKMVNDRQGRNLIEAIKTIPESNPTFVETWGGHYGVLAYAKWVSKELDNILLFKVNDQLDGLPARERLATVIYTTPPVMKRIPPGIWTRTFLLPVTLNSPVENVIAIDHRFFERVPNRRTQPAQFEVEVDQAKAWFTPEGDVRVMIDWRSTRSVNTDYRIFIYLSDNPFDVKSEGDILARYEQNAPVYGFYPTSRWRDDLRVRDQYRLTLPRELTRLPVHVYFGLATSVRGISIPQFMRAVPIENREP
ncbi:MAG: DUF2723 domain-containing protein [Anaerolineae bacterium]|nr:DUF2723 domain-containing protein [Anaerolineae bacterium]